MNYTILHH